MPHRQWNRKELLKVSGSLWETCALQTAVALDVFSVLSANPLTGEEVAKTINVPVDGLCRLLNALVGMQLLVKTSGKYSVTDDSRTFLSKDSDKDIGFLIRHHHNLSKTWSRLDEAIGLVNRLGTILTVDIKPGTTVPIDEQDVEKAIQILLKERNDHFNNLYEKAKLYKEMFVEIVFDNVEYDPDDEDQTWLEQYGLITNKDGNAVVANNIYKARYIKTFFKEVKAYEEISPQEYALPGDRLDMKRILLNFGRYISQICVRAFYAEEKPYEKTGQFLLTAWLYQFVKSGEGDVRDELLSGLGRLDIMLTYKGKKYIIETKVNRNDDISGIIEEAILQLSGKYLATEAASEGYLVVFDTRTPVGAVCDPQSHQAGDKQVTIITIAIGKPA